MSKRIPRIFIDKRGNWFQDGIRITHKWTYLSNNRNLDIDSNGNFYVDEGTGRIPVEVEDTPFVVNMVYQDNGEYYIRLNDETTEKLSFADLTINKENIPYTKVKNNKFTARFTTTAYYELTKHAISDGEMCYIVEKGKKHYLET